MSLIRFAVLFILLAGLGPGLSALAEIELGRAGDTGDHEVADSQSAPGAICRFAVPLDWSIGEAWLHVRPPMMFAHDATPRNDEQLVGWRAVVLAQEPESGDWVPFVTGETQRAMASEIYLAPFESRGPETQFFLGYGAYRVRLELFWYERFGLEGEPRVAGQAEYEIEHYAIAVRHRAGLRQVGVQPRCQLQP